MRGNGVGLVTAIITLLAVAWQGYQEYSKEHPVRVVAAQQETSAFVVPMYWNDGRRWYCQVGDRQYVWVNNAEQATCGSKSGHDCRLAAVNPSGVAVR